MQYTQANPFITGPNVRKALGYQQLTNVSSSTALTVPAGTSFVLIQAEAQAVRWRDDGVAPTASVGYPLPAGSELVYTGSDATLLRFIQQTAGAILNVCYYVA